MRARPKINFAYLIIGVAAIVMLVALLSAPRIRRYAREKARAVEHGAQPAPPAADRQSSP
ncbi:MAG TPA: hypothetical protein VF544_07985 [Pyrinomonadaceae bacterium]